MLHYDQHAFCKGMEYVDEVDGVDMISRPIRPVRPISPFPFAHFACEKKTLLVNFHQIGNIL